MKAIPDWPGYFASEEGHIYSNRRNSKELIRLAERTYERESKPRDVRYRHVFLYCRKSKQAKRFLLHRLICLAYHGPPSFDGAMALHEDDDPTNNAFSNLRWGTGAENHADSKRNGTAAIGERHRSAKLTE